MVYNGSSHSRRSYSYLLPHLYLQYALVYTATRNTRHDCLQTRSSLSACLPVCYCLSPASSHPRIAIDPIPAAWRVVFLSISCRTPVLSILLGLLRAMTILRIRLFFLLSSMTSVRPFILASFSRHLQMQPGPRRWLERPSGSMEQSLASTP